MLKDSRLEALEAELEVARSQNAEWHRLIALYDRERATNAAQKQQIEALQQQVLLPTLLVVLQVLVGLPTLHN